MWKIWKMEGVQFFINGKWKSYYFWSATSKYHKRGYEGRLIKIQKQHT